MKIYDIDLFVLIIYVSIFWIGDCKHTYTHKNILEIDDWVDKDTCCCE